MMETIAPNLLAAPLFHARIHPAFRPQGPAQPRAINQGPAQPRAIDRRIRVVGHRLCAEDWQHPGAARSDLPLYTPPELDGSRWRTG